MEEQNFNQAPPQFNQNPNPNPNSQGFYVQPPLPNSTGILVLGILSIVFCCGVGVILGIIALVMSGKANTLFMSNPNYYSLSSYKNMKAGKTCAIIGTVLGGLSILYWIIYVVILGAAISQMPWDQMHY
jgi:hypothetical protein